MAAAFWAVLAAWLATGAAGLRSPSTRRRHNAPKPWLRPNATVQARQTTRGRADAAADVAGKARVAVCLTGAVRSMHTAIVSDAMVHGLAPLAPFDVFAVLRAPHPGVQLDAEAEREWIPVQPVVHLKGLPSTPVSCHDRTCPKFSCAEQEELLRHCFVAVEASEKERGVKYEYIVKLRPDALILKALPSLARLRKLAPTPAVLLAPFAAFDKAKCMRWSGDSQSQYDRDYPPCGTSFPERSDFLLQDQFAILPREVAYSYFIRTAPKWSYSRYQEDLPEAEDAQWKTCRDHAGCECALSVVLRHQRKVNVTFLPFHVTLFREKNGGGRIHDKKFYPKEAVEWALESMPRPGHQ